MNRANARGDQAQVSSGRLCLQRRQMAGGQTRHMPAWGARAIARAVARMARGLGGARTRENPDVAHERRARAARARAGRARVV